MKNQDLLEKIMNEKMDSELRSNLICFMFNEVANGSERNTNGIPKLKNSLTSIDCDEAFRRMKTAAGGTGVEVAKILGISAQGFNNQMNRKKLSGDSLLDFHVKTGISLDWLVGSWNGNTADYYVTDIPGRSKPEICDQKLKKYLSLVETYNQITGTTELKWCLSKHHATCLDNDNLPVSDEFGAMYSLISRYKNEAGTPARVRSGNQYNFQVRRLIAYILSDAKLVRRVDGLVKKRTAAHVSGDFDRPGKTEFRNHSSKEECLEVFTQLAAEHGLRVYKPENANIAWDYLIGAGAISPHEWLINKYNDNRLSRWSGSVASQTGVSV